MKNNLFDMSGLTMLVTGATGYLGKEMCLGLAETGATILVNSRNLEKIEALVLELQELGYNAEPAQFDITKEEEISDFLRSYNGALSGIVNNAYYGKGGTIESSSSEDYALAYDITVTAAHTLFRSCLPLLKESVRKHGYASVINIASMYGCVSPDLGVYATPEGSNPPFYGAAKAALIQWTKYGACEFGHQGIRFNAISPGPFPNPEFNKAEFTAQLSQKVPMQRVGVAKEIQGPIVFLASKASSFVNGTNINVDGGWTVW